MAQRRVVTPEAVPLELPLASVGSRFLAVLIDWTIQAVTLVAVLLAAAVIASASGSSDRGAISALGYLLAFFVVFGYPVAFEVLRRGRTPGKAAVGLRVVTREGAPVGVRHASIRSALGLVDFLMTAGAAAVVSVMVTRDSQRLGDLVAGTVVVRERTGLKTPIAVEFAVPPGLAPLAAAIDVSGLSTSDYTTIRSFLLRAPSLPAAARTRLAAGLAATVAARVRHDRPSDVDPEDFLRTVAAARQARSAGRPPAPRDAPPPSPETVEGGADREGGGDFVQPA